MVWRLEAYDTETRTARSLRYTQSEIMREAWERIPRIDFTDSGHGIVFHAFPHPFRGKRKPELNASRYDAELQRARQELIKERNRG